jgi:PEP-CTERM motif-containing protein
MKKRRFVMLAVAAAISATIPTAAQTVPVGTPGYAAPIFDDTFGNCLPFGCHDVTRYQQIFSASLFPVLDDPYSFGQIRFFYSSFDSRLGGRPLQPANFTLRLYTTALTPYDLTTGWPGAVTNSPTYDLTDHLSGPQSTPFLNSSFPDTIFRGETLDFVSASPFSYDPAAGNLLLDIAVSYTDDPLADYPTLPNYFDADSTAYADEAFLPGSIGRAWMSNSNVASFGPGTGGDLRGLVTEFGPAGPQTVVPEPSTIGLLATGLIGIAGVARRRRRKGLADDC